MDRHALPPRMLRAAIRTCLPSEDRASLLGDLDELYGARVNRTGRVTANVWYARQAAGFVARVATARLAEAVGDVGAYGSDARLALRYFRRRPSFALAVVLTLGVGTGAVVTVYAAAEWLLLRPVPGVAEQGGLITLRLGMKVAPPHVSWDVSHDNLVTLRERVPGGIGVAGRRPIDLDMRAPGGAARRVAGEIVTSNYFEVLGHKLIAGRGFAPEDERIGARAAVAVLSHSLAASLHGGDAAGAVGADVRLNGATVRVVGIAGIGFRGAELPGRADLWMPLGTLGLVEPSSQSAPGPGATPVWRRIILRAPGVNPSDIAAVADAVLAPPPSPFSVSVTPGIGLDPGVRASVTRTLSIVAGVAVLLLTLAVANLVNLGLMEATSRARLTAIRVSLGATPARMVRAFGVEVILLGTGGALVAVALAATWSSWFQDTQLSEYGGSLQGMHVSGLVIVMGVFVAVCAAVLALVGAVALRRTRPLDGLLRTGNSAAAPPHRLRMSLVGIQVALTFVLLVVSGLLAGSVGNLRRIDLGFTPADLLVFSVDPHLHGYESKRLDQLGRDLESRLRQEPGIRAAGFVSPSPLRSSYFTASFSGSDAATAVAVVGAGYYVTPGFLTAVGVRVVAGTPMWDAQTGTVVISRNAVAKLFPGARPEDTIGRQLSLPRGRAGKLVRIAAVVEDLRLSDVTTEPPPSFFRPLSERPPGLSVSGLVATWQRPASAAAVVTAVLHARVPDLPVFDVRTAREGVDLQFAELRAMALVTTTLSAIGALLSAIGLYGVLANAVGSRRREIGIRAALGAAPARLIGGVLLSGALPVLAGVVVGAGVAAAMSQFLAQYLFGLGPVEPRVYAGTGAVIAAITGAACAVPAHRASRVSPASVLRED